MTPRPIQAYIERMRSEATSIFQGRMDSLDIQSAGADILENLDLMELELLMYDIKRRTDEDATV